MAYLTRAFALPRVQAKTLNKYKIKQSLKLKISLVGTAMTHTTICYHLLLCR